MGFEERTDLLGQSRVSPGARGFQLLYLAVDLFERFADRPHQVGNGLLAQFQIAAGGFLGTFQGRLGQVQERLVVALQCLGRERLEGVGELLPGIIQGGLQFLVLLFLVLQALVQDSPIRLPLRLGALVGLAGRRPEQHPGQQHADRHAE